MILPRIYQRTCLLLVVALTMNFGTAQQVVPLWADQAKVPFRKGTSDVDIPTLTVFLPEKSAGPTSAVVICPGGGYGKLSMSFEGITVAKWFQSRGVAGLVLKYRLPVNGYLHPVPLLDAQRAIRLVRSHAADWNLNPGKVGIMGFSAGGHLASTLSTHFDVEDAQAVDSIDRLGCRPDFAILVYPVISTQPGLIHRASFANLLGPNPDPSLWHSLSNETQVTAQTPPTILIHARDDKTVPVKNSEVYFQALQQAHVLSILQEYPQGGHGFGYQRVPDHSPSGWLDHMGAWLSSQRFIP